MRGSGDSLRSSDGQRGFLEDVASCCRRSFVRVDAEDGSLLTFGSSNVTEVVDRGGVDDRVLQ